MCIFFISDYFFTRNLATIFKRSALSDSNLDLVGVSGRPGGSYFVSMRVWSKYGMPRRNTCFPGKIQRRNYLRRTYYCIIVFSIPIATITTTKGNGKNPISRIFKCLYFIEPRAFSLRRVTRKQPDGNPSCRPSVDPFRSIPPDRTIYYNTQYCCPGRTYGFVCTNLYIFLYTL